MWYKIVKNGYITVIGKGSGGTQISEAEYNDIMTVMKTVPTAQMGMYMRRMCTDGHSSRNTLSLRRIICVSNHIVYGRETYSPVC